MADVELSASWASTSLQFFDASFDMHLEGSNPFNHLDMPEASTSSCPNGTIQPPPVPSARHFGANFSKKLVGYSYLINDTKDRWDKLFKEGYNSDVHILTTDSTVVPAHSSVLVSVKSFSAGLLENGK